MAQFTTHHKLPPFADDIQTAPLVSISLAKLEAKDKAESDAFFTASQNLGFFYMNMSGSRLGESIVEESEKLHALQQQFFALPDAEKDVYGRDKIDPFYAYRWRDTNNKTADGKAIRNESYNIRKDDILGNCERLPTHPLILAHNDLYKSYVLHCRAVIDLLISLLENHLKLPAGTIAKLHRVDHRSGDHVRFTQAGVAEYNELTAKGSEHTDFGTLTILFNWLGGLQIRVPDTDEWVWVKPIPGSAVINLGDALVKFSAGILRSNIHRVVPAVGPQAGMVRNSLVYFSRPEDDVILKRLHGGLIDAQPKQENEDVEITSAEWILRRSVGDLRGVYTHKGGLESRPSVYV